jgi:hypothetical protein
MDHSYTHTVTFITLCTTYIAIAMASATKTLPLEINLEQFALIEISERKMNLVYLGRCLATATS